MTGKLVRNVSVGAVVFAMLLMTALFYGPFSPKAAANPGIVIGFAIDGEGLVVSSERGEQLRKYLEEQLSVPVRMRSFASQDNLYSWLTRFGEVDIAWFNQEFLRQIPAGQVYALARNRDHASGLLQGEIVAGQSVDDALRQRVRNAFLAMDESDAGRDLLAELGLSGFAAPPLWQTRDWDVVAESAPQVTPPAMQGSAEAVEVVQDTADVPISPPTVRPAEEAPELAPVIPVPTPAVLPAVSADAIVSEAPTDAASPERPVVPEAPHIVTAEDLLRSTDVPDQPVSDEQVALVADSLAYNAEDDVYDAQGDVILRRADVELKAQQLLWQASTQDADARGSVQLSDAGGRASGDSMQYNMSTGQGQIRDGEVFISEGNFHLSGAEIEKQGQADYFVRNGSFTTCDGAIPDWKFTADEVDVTLGGYARAKHVFFHVKDIPVFYTPYLLFPVKTERESGFLMPMFGYSSSKGFLASLAWYQVIDRNMDATVYVDYLSDLALGTGLEYRYALANQNDGKALYYHVTGFDDTPPDDYDPYNPDTEEYFPDTYYLKWEHRGNLPGRWRLAADVEYAEDKEFFEEFGDVAADYNRDKTVSTVTLMRNWDKLNLVGYARYIKDLESDNDDTLQRLPEFSLGLARYRLGETPFYVGLESYATHFYREEGQDGDRLYLKPSLSAVFKPGSWLEITPEIAFHERLYDADTEDDEVFIPDFSLTAATRMTRVFAADLWGMDALLHSVEPKVVYRYVPEEDQDNLPLFDLYDRLGRLDRNNELGKINEVGYALVNRITARATAEDGTRSYRELLNLRLSQSYDIDEERNDPSGQDQPFSALRVELDFWPTSNLSLGAKSLIPVYGDDGLWSLDLGASVQDGAGNALRLDYTYRDQEFTGVETDYFSWQLDTALFKPLYLRYRERHDLVESRALERGLGLEYRAQCWSFLLSVQERYRENDDNDYEIMFNIVLSGLGQNQKPLLSKF